MSNENSTTNSPRRRVLNRVPSSGRSRRFSCITYLNETQLQICLMQHLNQIRAYAYAYHDKDTREDGTLKEPHIHLVFGTYNQCTVSAVRRWFSGYIDSKGMEITTTAQVCTDIYSMYDYLTHSTKEAREQGKYQYDKSIIQSNDKEGFFRASEESEFDSILLASEKLLNGAKVRDVGRIFGRDFILHYGAIRQYLNDVKRCKDYNKTLFDILDWEYQNEINRLNGDKAKKLDDDDDDF